MELCVMGGIQQQTEFVKVVVDVIRHSKHCIRRIYLGTDKNSKNDRFLHCLILFNFALKGCMSTSAGVYRFRTPLPNGEGKSLSAHKK